MLLLSQLSSISW